jgi:hypothetical protein
LEEDLIILAGKKEKGGRSSEMIKINSDWKERPQYKKGDIGEQIVRSYLEGKGWIVYEPVTDGPHYFDKLATKNKDRVIALDVKTKARLNYWSAQGINIKHYNEYINFTKTTSIPFFLFFVDDKNGDVHMVNILDLQDPIYPNSAIIAWDLKQMDYLFNIGEENIRLLSQFDTRNHDYSPIDESPILTDNQKNKYEL